jgi:hypothetical protein
MNPKHARIAMWSGPRNISTAMMRAWGNRDDTYVCDEPFYAHYLRETGIEHPGRDEVLQSQENDWSRVVDYLPGDTPGGRAIFYQKHMAHHLLPGMGRGWLRLVRNAMLIRDPREMITSLIKVTPRITVRDTGLPQQSEMFDFLSESGERPPVIDAKDVLADPRIMLTTLCRALNVPFQEAMLSWPPGTRDTDGVWAKHWYGMVEKSTGFQPYEPKPDEVPASLQKVYNECRRYYDKLYEHRLRP